MSLHNTLEAIIFLDMSGWLRSGKKVWKMKIFPGQGKVREFWFESGKLEKTDKSQGIVRELCPPTMGGVGRDILFLVRILSASAST